MINETMTAERSPMIVKYVEGVCTGVRSMSLSRYAIGYVLRGTKYIYEGDKRHAVGRGTVFCLGIGRHYVEDVPQPGQPYEQIVLYYTPADLQRILLHLNLNYGVTITNDHRCPRCADHAYVTAAACGTLRHYFHHLCAYLRQEDFRRDETAENIKMTELIYLLMTQGDRCMRHRLLGHADTEQENFEQVVYGYLFADISIEELAQKTHRSLTTFKKEFHRHFHMPPHRWFICQRLMQARLLLISTSKSISEIGNECSFPNTSHFIKLFKKEFRTTPAAYRTAHLAEPAAPSGAVSRPAAGRVPLAANG